MNIKVRFAGSMRELAGMRELGISMTEGATILNLFSRLSEMLPESFHLQILSQIIQADRKITILLHNRKNIHDQDSLSTLLHDGDELAFVPPMEGG